MSEPLDDDGLFRADMAFIDVIKKGGTQAEAVRAAICAYLADSESEFEIGVGEV